MSRGPGLCGRTRAGRACVTRGQDGCTAAPRGAASMTHPRPRTGQRAVRRGGAHHHRGPRGAPALHPRPRPQQLASCPVPARGSGAGGACSPCWSRGTQGSERARRAPRVTGTRQRPVGKGRHVRSRRAPHRRLEGGRGHLQGRGSRSCASRAAGSVQGPKGHSFLLSEANRRGPSACFVCFCCKAETFC